jgi:hypothetical protein
MMVQTKEIIMESPDFCSRGSCFLVPKVHVVSFLRCLTYNLSDLDFTKRNYKGFSELHVLIYLDPNAGRELHRILTSSRLH